MDRIAPGPPTRAIAASPERRRLPALSSYSWVLLRSHSRQHLRWGTYHRPVLFRATHMSAFHRAVMDFAEQVSGRLKMSDLRMLLAVAHWGSMSKAAAHLNISQSA